jgi:hypothetical protein
MADARRETTRPRVCRRHGTCGLEAVAMRAATAVAAHPGAGDRPSGLQVCLLAPRERSKAAPALPVRGYSGVGSAPNTRLGVNEGTPCSVPFLSRPGLLPEPSRRTEPTHRQAHSPIDTSEPNAPCLYRRDFGRRRYEPGRGRVQRLL